MKSLLMAVVLRNNRKAKSVKRKRIQGLSTKSAANDDQSNEVYVKIDPHFQEEITNLSELIRLLIAELKCKRKRKIESKSESTIIKIDEGCLKGDEEKCADEVVSRKRKIDVGCSQEVRAKRHRVKSKVKKQPQLEFSRPPPVNNPRTVGWIELSLAHHEREQGVEFEYVEVVSENCQIVWSRINGPVGWYCHLFFKAKPKNVQCTDVSPQPFFAELHICDANVCVLYCCIVDPNDPGTTRGCGICPPENNLIHPANGYIAGLFPYNAPITVDWPCVVPGDLDGNVG